MQAHPIKSLETLVAEVMKEVMSFTEIKLKCSLFTYHILKLLISTKETYFVFPHHPSPSFL